MPDKIKCNQCSKTFTNAGTLADHKVSAHPALRGKDFEEKFANLRDRAIDIEWEFLNSDGSDTGLRNREQSARQVLSNWTRHEATKSNREQTNLLTARSLAQNPEQLAEYVRLTMPHSPILKALPSKTDGKEPS